MSFSITQNFDPIVRFTMDKAIDRTTVNIGDLKWSVLNHDTNGWLICNGRSLSIQNYPLLYQAIGTTFGQSNQTTFNLPDCRSRVIGAIGQGNGLSNRTTGEMTGEETHQLTIPEMPSHNHSGSTGSTTLTISPNNVVTGVSYSSERTTALSGLSDVLVTGVNSTTSVTSVNPNPHNHTISSQGGDIPHNNMQPTLFIGNVMIFSGYDYNFS
jgi:microcystin-dependent protein